MIFIYAILFGAFFVVGYKMGKSSYTEKTVESYVDIPRVTVKPTIPEPISEKKSEKPLPVDVVKESNKDYNQNSIPEDSVSIYRAVYNDYVKAREYEFEAINNDTIGKITVKSGIGFNRLSSFTLDLDLKQKVVTKYKVPKWRLSTGIGYNSFQDGVGVIDVQLDYKNFGFNANMIATPDFKYKGYGGTVRYYWK